MHPYHEFNHNEATMDTNQFCNNVILFSWVFKPLCSVCSYQIRRKNFRFVTYWSDMQGNPKNVWVFLPQSSAIWKLFVTQQIKCFTLDTLWMPYNHHIGIYDINKSTETSEWVVTSMQFWTNACLNQSGFEIEMIFQCCDATFMDTKNTQVSYGPLRKISMFWIAIPRFLCFINFICIS